MSSWSDSDADFKKWLPIRGNKESVLSLIKYMGMDLLNATDNQNILNLIDKRKIIGFICNIKRSIQFKTSKVIKDTGFLPTNVENGYPTIGLLNLAIGHFKGQGFGPILSEYSGDLDVESRISFFRPQIITPIAFAHNFTAKNYNKDNDNTYVYCFSYQDGKHILVGNDGEHIQTEFTSKSVSKLIDEMNKLGGDVVIVIEDPLKQLTEQLQQQIDIISRLTKETETDQNSSYMDDSMTYEDLMELQKLSREFEEAESFELSLGEASKSKTNENQHDSEALKEKSEAEEKVIMLKKKLSDIKEILSFTYSEVYDSKTLYTSETYLEFLQFYKRNVHVKTPKVLKHSSLGKSPIPIKTPKSNRKRFGSTFSSSSAGSILTNTPNSTKGFRTPAKDTTNVVIDSTPTKSRKRLNVNTTTTPVKKRRSSRLQ